MSYPHPSCTAPRRAVGRARPRDARAERASFGTVPRHWLWTQAAILVFVIAGIVIAITRLA
jgi:hypothetical protein